MTTKKRTTKRTRTKSENPAEKLPEREPAIPLTKGMKVVGRKTMRLACRLTETEQIAAGRELASVCYEQGQVEEEKRASQSGFKSRLEGLAARASALASKAHDGLEHRDVECDEIRDLPKDVMLVVRRDTGEVVSQRTLTEAERQDNLFDFEGPKAVDDKKAGDEEPEPVGAGKDA